MRLFLISCCVWLLGEEPALFGQIDTTLSDFFPLQVGNCWVYEETRPFPVTITVRVEGDTLLSEGRFYEMKSIDEQYGESLSFYRINQSMEVLEYKNGESVLLYRLGATPGEEWLTSDSLWLVTMDGEGVAWIFEGPRRYKEFTFHLYPYALVEVTRYLVEGIGLYSYYGHIDAPNGVLIGAIVGDSTYGNPTKVEGDPIFQVPPTYEIRQNYPNPFNPSTTIRYELPKRSHIVLKIYNLLGQEVATLVNEEKTAGRYEVGWDAGGMASGVYFYRLQAGEFVETKTLILVK